MITIDEIKEALIQEKDYCNVDLSFYVGLDGEYSIMSAYHKDTNLQDYLDDEDIIRLVLDKISPIMYTVYDAREIDYELQPEADD